MPNHQRNKVLQPSIYKGKAKAKIDYDDSDDETHLIKENNIDNKNSEEEVNLAELRRETELLSSFMRSEFNFGSKWHSKVNQRQFEDKLQIIYCCRTHSQISQVISEINKLPKLLENIVVIPLSSRKYTCINPTANPKDTPLHPNVINDRCKDLLECNKCIYNQIGELQVESLSSKITSPKSIPHVMDIEEIVSLGKATVTCPYFAIRNCITSADILILPYQSLLHPETREQLCLPLENRVLLFDEAHNIFQTVNQLSSLTIPNSLLSSCKTVVSLYLKKYKSRLSEFSSKTLGLIVEFLQNLVNLVVKQKDTEDKKSKEFYENTICNSK